MRITRALLIAMSIGTVASALTAGPPLSAAGTISTVGGEAYHSPDLLRPGASIAPLPDLIVKELKIVGSNKLRVTVQNRGEAPAPPCVLQIKVFKGLLSDVLYSTRLNVPGIPAHQKKVLLFNTRGRPLDGNSIRATVDATKLVEEADEDNNEESLTTAP